MAFTEARDMRSLKPACNLQESMGTAFPVIPLDLAVWE